MSLKMEKMSFILRKWRILHSSLEHRYINHINKFSNSSSLNDVHTITMPALSPTMAQGTIIKWHKAEGDTVVAGDLLCDIQTDKAVVSMDTEEEGILAKILKPENSVDVNIGSLIALMVDEGDDWQNVEVPPDGDDPQTSLSTTQATSQLVASTDGTKIQRDNERYGPAVRSILHSYNIPIQVVKGTGPHGRILKGDLLQHILDHKLQPVVQTPEPLPTVTVPETKSSAPISKPTTPAPSVSAPSKWVTPIPAPGTEYVDKDISNMRRTIAKRLTQSKTTIPHSYCTIDCNMSAITQLRAQYKQDGIKVSVNDFIVKAVAVALQQVPEVNATFENDTVRLSDSVDISVAVATDSGLITPIVKDAAGRGLQNIASNVRELALKARDRKLQPEEFIGGTFTISNLGMFGISEFSAVINPPQSCIMAVGGSRVVVNSDGEPQTMMSVTLSSDARAVSDDTAAHFAKVFKDNMEDPMLMLSAMPQTKRETDIVEDEEKLHAALFAK